jgi:hypothetical protein
VISISLFLKESEILILKHLIYNYMHRTNPTWFDMIINERSATYLTITRKPVTVVISLRIYGANDLFKHSLRFYKAKPSHGRAVIKFPEVTSP